MDIDVSGLLMDLGVTNATNIQRPPQLRRCELWVGEDDSIVATNSKMRVLILHSGFSEENIDTAKQQLTAIASGQIQIILLEDSAPSLDLQKKVQIAFPTARILTIGASLRQAIFRGQTVSEPAPIEYYVPPTVVAAAGPPSNESAILMLLGWMRGGSPSHISPSRVGILLAPAGTGKTALAIELYKDFLKFHFSDSRSRRTSAWPFPLLVDRSAWIDHEFRDTTNNLADLVGNAINRQFGFQPSIDRIQRCLRYGAICPILDGFDELCATKASLFGADDTIAGLIQTLEGVDGSRILLTCRESFWHDNVDVTLQSKVTAFRLSPFSEAQRREYLNKRFPQDTERRKKERTMSLLSKIADLRSARNSLQEINELNNLSFLPWVVQFAAEAADSMVLDNSVFDSIGSIPNADPLGHVLWQFCRREQQRIGIALRPESQIRLFSNLAATCDDWFSVDHVNSVHDVLSGEPSYEGAPTHVEFLRKHGFLRIVGKETPNNCRFEYPEVQDYLRARIAVDSICGEPSVLGDDDVFRRCAIEQVRLVDFISLLLRWRLPQDEIVDAIASQRGRFMELENVRSAAARAGLLQILLRTLRDNDSLTASDVTRNLCRYFGDRTGHTIDKGYFSGLFSRLDLRGIRIIRTKFNNVHLEHCRFDRGTRFDDCLFEGEFGAALSCKGLGEAILNDGCKLSTNAVATFRYHKNNVGGVRIDRNHIDDACHHVLKQFHIGQMGFRSKASDDIEHEAAKASPIGDDILAELIRCGVLAEKKAGTRRSLEVADKSAVSSFLQQSTPRQTMAEVIKRLTNRHIKIQTGN
jgi:hypothetical protein